MIKVEKDLSNIPDSLKIPIEENFEGNIPLTSKTTHKRREEVIGKGEYIEEGKYNDRYKVEDIRTALKSIYKHKCAFCEQKVEQYHVEHYRPKKVYYWLAFSWDNLLMACPTCNEHKGVNFDLQGEMVDYVDNDENLKAINQSSKSYNEKELPKMVNPELTNPLGKIQFQRNGIIESDDVCFSYTIEKCKIDRDYLNDERRDILNIFERDIKSALVEFSTPDEQQYEIGSIVRKFIKDSEYEKNQFLAFRKYAITNGWLSDITKESKRLNN